MYATLFIEPVHGKQAFGPLSHIFGASPECEGFQTYFRIDYCVYFREFCKSPKFTADFRCAHWFRGPVSGREKRVWGHAVKYSGRHPAEAPGRTRSPTAPRRCCPPPRPAAPPWCGRGPAALASSWTPPGPPGARSRRRRAPPRRPSAGPNSPATPSSTWPAPARKCCLATSHCNARQHPRCTVSTSCVSPKLSTKAVADR